MVVVRAKQFRAGGISKEELMEDAADTQTALMEMVDSECVPGDGGFGRKPNEWEAMPSSLQKEICEISTMK